MKNRTLIVMLATVVLVAAAAWMFVRQSGGGRAHTAAAEASTIAGPVQPSDASRSAAAAPAEAAGGRRPVGTTAYPQAGQGRYAADPADAPGTEPGGERVDLGVADPADGQPAGAAAPQQRTPTANDAAPGLPDVVEAPVERSAEVRAFKEMMLGRAPQMPVAFTDAYPSSLDMNKDQWAAVERIAEQFTQEMGGTNANPNAPDYRKRWISAQQLADERLRAQIGWSAFAALQQGRAIEAAQAAQKAKQAPVPGQ